MTQRGDWDRLSEVLSFWPNLSRWPNRRAASAQFRFAPEARDRGLWSTETFSRGIVETSPDCIEVMDPQGNLQFANKAARRSLRNSNTSENEGEPWIDT